MACHLKVLFMAKISGAASCCMNVEPCDLSAKHGVVWGFGKYNMHPLSHTNIFAR